MKKLLTVLGSLMISASGASLVVACNKPTTNTTQPTNNTNTPTTPSGSMNNNEGQPKPTPRPYSKSEWDNIFKYSITGWDIESHTEKQPKQPETKLPKFPKQNLEVGTYSKKEVLDNSSFHKTIKTKVAELLKIDAKTLTVVDVYYDNESGEANVKSTLYSDVLKVKFVVKTQPNKPILVGSYTRSQILDHTSFYKSIKTNLAKEFKISEMDIKIIGIYYDGKTGGGVAKSPRTNLIKFEFKVLAENKIAVVKDLNVGEYTKNEILDNSNFYKKVKKILAEKLKIDESKITISDVTYEDKSGEGTVKSSELKKELKFTFTLK
uniref:Variable prolipoprotein n=1 Tax=Mycoplasma feriruminatoris TaxID=1179777 RepID=A0A654ILU0_9MOLU|nr:hypothetical protein MF5582_00124 [Mycoplasma feriruminatoris]